MTCAAIVFPVAVAVTVGFAALARPDRPLAPTPTGYGVRDGRDDRRLTPLQRKGAA